MNSIQIKEYRKRNDLTQKELAEIVRTSIRSVQSWEQGNRNISQSAIKILTDYETERNYNVAQAERVNQSVRIIHELFKPIPFYNLDVRAGNVSFMDNGLVKGQSPDDYMYIPIQVDADIAFPTYGHSMYPEISNGDRVAYKFIKDWSFFNYGMKYLIVTDEQRMVKYLKRHVKEGYVLLVSRNEDYQPIDMPISSIRAILQVRYIGKIEM
ncbi:MAG: XRE family transcriptional regulator [Flavobacteriaceae bacterium]|nr:XRE family transcriptional regulator [Flavobacteriaceae bacterium]